MYSKAKLAKSLIVSYRHDITNIPIRNINRLELFALKVLGHDLSVNPVDWEKWLQYLYHYHMTRYPYPAPIQRPSMSDPITHVRKVLEDLIDIKESGHEQTQTPFPPRPAFCPTSLITGKKAATPAGTSLLEFDLDEDGPLREEYAIKQASRVTSKTSFQRTESLGIRMSKGGATRVPPPAEWSPSYDPPLSRSIHGNQGFLSYAKPYDAVHGGELNPMFWNISYGTARPQILGKLMPHEQTLQPSSINGPLDRDCLPKNNGSAPALVLPITSSQHRSLPHTFTNGIETCYPTFNGLPDSYSYGDNFINHSHFRPLWLYA